MIALLPAIILILAIIFIFSVTWTNATGAPWVPSTRKTVESMLEMAEVTPDDVVYDLGCGDGRTVITAARSYGARAVGIEIDPLRYLWCQIAITVLGLRNQVQIIFGNFFDQDLSEATVVTCYLLQSTNPDLESKFHAELTPGTRIVSNTFSFRSLQRVRQSNNAQLYLR